jgi:hypothetical protein
MAGICLRQLQAYCCLLQAGLGQGSSCRHAGGTRWGVIRPRLLKQQQCRSFCYLKTRQEQAMGPAAGAVYSQ